VKPKKNTRQRGGKTHGWGSKKKHRGAGNRGGRGNAGSGKRGDQKKPSYWNSALPKKAGQKRGQSYFGKYGFGMGKRSDLSVITVRDLDSHLPQFVAEKKATNAGGVYTIDLTKLGYEKLLGTGQFRSKANVTVPVATPSAVAKVQEAGGSVAVADKPVKEKKAPADAAKKAKK
jgi:large subunit ribosomal protein L15